MQSILNRNIRILVINPNTGDAMTKQIENSLRTLDVGDVEFDVLTNIGGPVSIEGHTDEIISSYYILRLIAQRKENYDGYLIACFSDHPSIAMLRELTGKPVVGIAEAACHMASMVGNRFAIVTTSPKWVPMLREAVRTFGVEEKCAGVWTSGLSVVQLHELSDKEVEEAIIDAGRLAILAGAEVICLGCAGMSGLQARIMQELKVPVVDSCEAGFMMLYSLCKMGAETSRICMYASNEPRKTVNLDKELQMFYEQ